GSDPWWQGGTVREVPPAVRGVAPGRVVAMAPDRRPHAVLGPDRTIGEADLAPDRTLATLTAPRVHVPRDRVSSGLVERRILLGESLDQAVGIRRVEDRFCRLHRRVPRDVKESLPWRRTRR